MYKTGAIFSGVDVRDYKGVCCANTQEFPKEFELSMPDVKNQGNVGSCVAHALSTVVEYYNKHQHNMTDKMSTGYIYGNRRNSIYKGEGMIMRDALKNVCSGGDVLNSKFPLNIEVPAAIEEFEKNVENLQPAAYPYRFSEYARLYNNDDIKAALLAGCPVVFAIPWYKKATVVDSKLTFNSEERNGSHCMVIYGWNEEGFKFQNSWGPLWGNGGRAILPYEIKVHEAWSVTDNVTEGNLDIKKPFHSELGNVIAKIVNIIANALTSLLKK